MRIIEPGQRPYPRITAKTHARLRHDYATWHPEHVEQVNRKTSSKIPFSNRSKFDSATIITDAISKSRLYPATVGNNGNYVIVFDMGYLVGFDERSQRQTSTVTVIMEPNGEVVTAHPGAPWSKTPTED